MTLGKRLKVLRVEKGKSIREAAKDLGIGKSTLACYEIDTRNPDYDQLRKLANYYGKTVSYLLGEDEPVVELTGEDIPLELRELGVEYIPYMKELKDNKIPEEVVKNMVKAIIAMNDKDE